MEEKEKEKPLDVFLQTVFGDSTLGDISEAEKQSITALFGGLLSATEQSAALDPIQELAQHVNKATEIIENLAMVINEPTQVALLGDMKRHLVITSELLSSEKSPQSNSKLPLVEQLKKLLLREFDFINHWLR